MNTTVLEKILKNRIAEKIDENGETILEEDVTRFLELTDLLDLTEKNKLSRKDEDESSADVLQVEVSSVQSSDTVRYILKLKILWNENNYY